MISPYLKRPLRSLQEMLAGSDEERLGAAVLPALGFVAAPEPDAAGPAQTSVDRIADR